MFLPPAVFCLSHAYAAASSLRKGSISIRIVCGDDHSPPLRLGSPERGRRAGGSRRAGVLSGQELATTRWCGCWRDVWALHGFGSEGVSHLSVGARLSRSYA